MAKTPSMFHVPAQFRSECVIQAEFFRQCCAIDLPCTLELSTPVGRLDAAIFNAEWTRLLAVVEVKKRDEFSPGQIARYKRLHVPVFGLYRFERAARLAAQIKRDYFVSTAHFGVDWQYIQAIPKAVRSRGRKQRFDPAMDLDENLIYRS
jgi:hypothetical protein